MSARLVQNIMRQYSRRHRENIFLGYGQVTKKGTNFTRSYPVRVPADDKLMACTAPKTPGTKLDTRNVSVWNKDNKKCQGNSYQAEFQFVLESTGTVSIRVVNKFGTWNEVTCNANEAITTGNLQDQTEQNFDLSDKSSDAQIRFYETHFPVTFG